ncbi:Bug family tripartite tricarboxylate transporter substrate binding protein [Amaricoccus macauensis]|uniref:Bug family tripartite tricarboxylate transporter substrate binding protein n=1 Tax=Amaricoccus macauensis TaxID=57001 RepID=UPI003C7E59FC
MHKSFARTALLAVTAAGAMLASAPSPAKAEYPEKPVTMVIPYGPGGSHDLNARIVTSILPEYLGQPVVVRLTPGAGGQKGTQEVGRSRPDGYTLLFTSNQIDMLQPHVENVPYEPLEDFVPVVRVNYAPASIVVRADSPFETFDELVSYAQEHPGELQLGHSGNWGAFFVAAAQIMKEKDFMMNMVPYQGGGPAMQALLSGDSDMTMAFPSSLGELVESGDIRVLATAGEEPIFDGVPTFSDVGIDGDIGYMHRFILVPSETPQEVIDTLTTAFEGLFADEDFNRLMSELGENVEWLPGAEYQALREKQAQEYEVLVNELTSQ